MQLPFTKKPENSGSTRRYVFGLEISPKVIKSAIWTLANGRPQVVVTSQAVPWDDKTAASLIESVDKSLTESGNHLDPTGKTQITEVIFGVPASWVAQDKITQDHLGLLKEMSTSLELKAVGFVVTTEAIIKALQQIENVPATAILLGFWEEVLEVTLVKMGKIMGSHLVRRSSNLTSDVIEGLSRFESTEPLPSRMLLYDSGINLEEIKQMLLAHPWQSTSKKLPFLHFPKVEVLPANFSVKSVCVAAGGEVVWDEPVVEPVPVVAPSDLGFVMNADAAAQRVEPVVPELNEMPIVAKPKFNFTMPKFNFSLPNFKFNWLMVALIALVFLGGLGLAYWFLPKATISVTVVPKDFQGQTDLSLNTQSVTTSVDLTSQANTTGSKVVGDAAGGQVTISSTLDSAKTFPAGTVLTSPSGLKFVTNDSVTVASASGSADSLVPGKTNVKVTASAIGTDSNLSSGTVFRVGSNAVTQIAAKNDAAMAGGTSRQARAVSADDISKLESQIIASAKQQAQDKLTTQIDANTTVLPESVSVTIAKENMDHKAGEEADSVTIQVTAKAVALTVAKADLDAAIRDQILSQLPAGFTNVTQSSQSFSGLKTDKDNKTTLNVQITAKLLPVIDHIKIKDSLLGKSVTAARDILSQIPGSTKIDIQTWLGYLPHISANIDLQIHAQ